ncbi:FAD-binding oxidoreductase [Candidatus Leptofilum sp.]|uniref:FAD-binding oxidoreductase n=1 Tax=Candidatus Leptofilum sp. TaxID=3241576 RepID=UPI003B5B950B
MNPIMNIKDNVLSSSAAEQFRQALHGYLVTRDDEAFEEARQLYNGMIDKRPLLIAYCANVADVVMAVKFAQKHSLLVAVRGGGHNGAGLGSCDDGLIIDLSRLNQVEVCPDNQTVRVGAGCASGDIDKATHAHGLAVPLGIVASTGVAGLTLGGGHGYLTRKYGLTIDNLLEAQVVLADGRMVTASESENSDLFWALRGGGGNFGIVTNFLFQAHPVSSVYGGPIFWRLADSPAIMRAYRTFIGTAPHELCTFFGLKVVPSVDPFPREIWGEKICALISCYTGTAEEGEKLLRPLRDALPEPIMDGMTMMPFPDLQSMFDPLLPAGLQWYWKGDFINELPDEAIDLHVQFAQNFPTDQSIMHLYPIDGAVHEVEAAATAWHQRDVTWSMVIAGISDNPTKADALKQWGRDYWQAIHSHSAGSAYINFMMEEGQARIKATYGANYERLATIKRKYDPTNFFRVNQNILPK